MVVTCIKREFIQHLPIPASAAAEELLAVRVDPIPFIIWSGIGGRGISPGVYCSIFSLPSTIYVSLNILIIHSLGALLSLICLSFTDFVVFESSTTCRFIPRGTIIAVTLASRLASRLESLSSSEGKNSESRPPACLSSAPKPCPRSLALVEGSSPGLAESSLLH